MTNGAPATHEFGDFRLDAPGRRLWRGNQPVPLGQKAVDALVRLLQAQGELVGKDELIGMLWPDTSVQENNLNQQISALRKALGETAENPRHIITVAGRGYRFLSNPIGAAPEGSPPAAAAVLVSPAPDSIATGAVVPHRRSNSVVNVDGHENRRTRPRRMMALGILGLLLAAAAGAASLTIWQNADTRAADAHPIRTLAVLPLRTLNAAGSDDHFGLGMADAIIRNLSDFEGVLIRPVGAVQRYAETPTEPTMAGRALSVDAVLDGTMQRDGDRLRVSVQLVRVANGASLWTEQFDTIWNDIFSVQDQIAQQIARALTLQLKGSAVAAPRTARPTTDPEAYAAYLKSRYFWNKRTAEGYLKGISQAEVAVARDPSFAQAYAALADCYALLGSSAGSSIARAEAMNRARHAAERSLSLNPSSAEATTSLAFVKMHYDWDWVESERFFQNALQLDPDYATAHHWYAYYLTARQRHDEAIAHIRRARDLDPLSVIIATDVGELLLYAGRVEEAVTAAHAALELDPAFDLAHRVLAWAEMRRGNHENALKTLLAAAKRSGDDAGDGLATVGHIYGLLGRRREAEAIAEAFKRRSTDSSELGIQLSIISAGLSKKDDAFYWLERAYRARSGSLILLRVEPLWAPLRDDARFVDLARRIGLLTASSF